MRGRLERSHQVEEEAEAAAGTSSHKSSFQGDVPRIHLTPSTRPHVHRSANENFENAEVEELLAMLRETESLEEQGDILQYLVDTQGLDFNTGEWINFRWLPNWGEWKGSSLMRNGEKILQIYWLLFMRIIGE